MRWRVNCLEIAGLVLFMVLSVFIGYSAAAQGPSATSGFSKQEILRKADEARGNLEGISWEVSIVSSEHERSSRMDFDVKARGFDTLAESLLPPKDKGNKVLMVNGNMWFYKPGLSKAVPISRRQKLIGNAAYGDIASTNYDDDYDSTPLVDEVVNGESCYVFSLKAKTANATYDRIKYWISKEKCLGIKAEYFTVSGKKFKSATMKYENRVRVNGNPHPFISEIKIRDDIMKKESTILRFRKARSGRIADHVFNLNLLRR